MSRVRSFLQVCAVPLRMLAAFLFGWVSAFVLSPFSSAGILIGYLILFPSILFGMGVAGYATVSEGRKHRIALALLTGVVIVTGWWVYFVPGAEQSDARRDACSRDISAALDCSSVRHNMISSYTNLVLTLWIISCLVVLVGALVVALVVHGIIYCRGISRRTNEAQSDGRRSGSGT